MGTRLNAWLMPFFRLTDLTGVYTLEAAHSDATLRKGGLRDALLFVMPTTAAAGGLLPGPSGLFGFRMVLLFAMLIAISDRRRLETYGFASVVLCWTGFMTAGLFKTHDLAMSMRVVANVVFGLGAIWTTYRVCDSYRRFLVLVKGWGAAFLCTSAVALWEVASGRHLPNYLIGQDLDRIDTRMLASTFGNPNGYAVFIGLVFPAMAAAGLTSKSRGQRILGYTGAAVAILLMVLTGSRIGLAAMVLECIALLWLAGTSRAFRFVGVVSVGIIGTMFLWGSQIEAAAPAKVTTLVHLITSAGVGSDVSGDIRLNLYKDGLLIIKNSAGLGVGPGMYEWNLRFGGLPYSTVGIFSPHSGFLEIAGEFGVVTLCVFVAWIARVTFAARKATSRDGSYAAGIGVTFASTSIGLVVLAFAHSSFLIGSVNWMYFGSLAAFATLAAPQASQFQRAQATAEGVKAACEAE